MNLRGQSWAAFGPKRKTLAISLLLGLLFILVIVRLTTPVRHTFSFAIVKQQTTAGRDAGKPLILAQEQPFSKNDLLAILVDTPVKGFLYAFQGFKDGSFEVLFPLSPGLAAVGQAQRTRLPNEVDKWLGFLNSSVTLVWSPSPVAELEEAIISSEVEEDDIRTIREPEPARKLEGFLRTITVHTRRNIVQNPNQRSEISSTDHQVAYRIQIQVE